MADSSVPYGGSTTDERAGYNVGTGQLVQLRVPLDEAADAFAQSDSQGRTPIVVVPLTPSRIHRELLALGALVIAVGLLVMGFIGRPDLTPWVVLVGVVLIAVAAWRAFWLLVPEGTTALLTRGGRHVGTRDGGSHFIAPM